VAALGGGGISPAPPNNSFNRSGISLSLIENLWPDEVTSRPVNSSVRRLKLNKAQQSCEIKAGPPHLNFLLTVVEN
jgi:hypothetical protein